MDRADAPAPPAVGWLRDLGTGRGDLVALAIVPERGVAFATANEACAWPTPHPVSVIAEVEARVGPRWVWWDRETPDAIVEADATVARCWDLHVVHRLLHGGWRTSIAECWAAAHGLAADSLPTIGQLDLLGDHADEGGDPDDPVRPDGHLRPEWIAGGWQQAPDRWARWAELVLEVRDEQRRRLDELPDPDRAASTAHSESAAEVLCAELAHSGLPVDHDEAVRIIADAVGPRPADDRHADDLRRERDEAVLRHLDGGPSIDLRNPADVKAMLRRVAVDVPDTRAWRLERHRDAHPLVPALLTWRKAERIATTYGYRWLDEHVAGGRLRGEWSSSDGAAGRMTASAGLHNLPGELRPAIAAERGFRLVRADLGQIEPRVLAAVSGDAGLVAATADADLYQPVADRLRVERAIAKVAVLGAMYGATTGESAHALRGLERAYPTAMEYLETAAAAGRRGDDVYTVGGRRVRMWIDDTVDDAGVGDIERARRVAAARGRFARNAIVQGAAAEFFKVWAIIARNRLRPLGAEIVLCLHDELLVHAPTARSEEAAHVVTDSLAEAAFRWSPEPEVRFVADVSVIDRWSDAKD